MNESSARSPAHVEAVIIAVGSELARGRVQDTNTAWLAEGLFRLGADIRHACIVPDDRLRLEAAIREGVASGAVLVVISGGLGPTSDDITAAAVAGALGLPLELDEGALAAMRRKIGFDEPEKHHLKQATLPAGCSMLPPAGTAPGFVYGLEESVLVALPGVPRELQEMWQDALAETAVQDRLRASPVMESLAACFYGCGEPSLDAALSGLLEGRDGIEAGICSRHGEVEVRLDFPSGARAAAVAVIEALRERFAEFYYSAGVSAATVVIDRLNAAGKTLAVAESCTGGLLAGELTDVSGASAVFRGGVVAYHNDIKTGQLGVREEILANTGAVSRPVAQWMAVGARKRLEADYGIGITGIAGPDGGSDEKPVGLVYICASSPLKDNVMRFNFAGGRTEVRAAAVVSALHMLLDLIDEGEPGSNAAGA